MSARISVDLTLTSQSKVFGHLVSLVSKWAWICREEHSSREYIRHLETIRASMVDVECM